MLVQRIYADMQSGKTTMALAMFFGYIRMGLTTLYIVHRPEAAKHLAQRSGLPSDCFITWTSRLVSNDLLLNYDAIILDEVNLFRDGQEGDPVQLLKQRFAKAKRPMQIIGFYTD